MSNEHTRAPKHGVTIDGVFYAGGQFLPSDNVPKRGKFNRPKRARTGKPRKVQISRNEWVEKPDNRQSIWVTVAGTVARPDWDNNPNRLIFSASQQVLDYRGMTESEARALIDAFNAGKRWVDEIDTP